MKLAPTYESIGDHAEAVRVVFDPGVLGLHDLLELYFSIAPRRMGGGQYRSELYAHTQAQLQVIQEFNKDIPVVSPSTDRARFWSAEDYHQKYRLRRFPNVVKLLLENLGPNWDEHVWATKLNARDSKGVIKPWLQEMPTELASEIAHRWS